MSEERLRAAVEALLTVAFRDDDFLTQNGISMTATPGVRRALRRVRAALAASGATLDGRAVHAAWRDGMLAQGREVSAERMSWDTLSEQDRDLDDGIAARLSGAVTFSDDPNMQRGLVGQASEKARRLAERMALAARTHVPAIDDFGNQYLAASGATLDVERLARATCIDAESIESDPVDFDDCPDREEHIEYARFLAAEYARLSDTPEAVTPGCPCTADESVRVCSTCGHDDHGAEGCHD